LIGQRMDELASQNDNANHGRPTASQSCEGDWEFKWFA